MGSTGSIGESTLNVAAQFPDRFKVNAIAGGKRIDRLAAQARQFSVPLVSCESREDAARLKELLPPSCRVVWGSEGLLEVAQNSDAQMVVSALVGSVGLVPTFAALKAGRDVALANKETLVVAGEPVMAEAKRSGAKLLPVDSEHSAIFQVLQGRDLSEVKRLVLTASGGPFRGRRAKEVASVPPEEALKHPNWSMGPKISIDSATMMNKGLEVIEAHWLFGVPAEKIAVAVHPQSIIHSMVEFIDGSLLAQLGTPDMRGPIGFALAYPERLPMERELGLDLFNTPPLTFEAPDLEAFPCLGLAYEALKAKGTAPATLNGANEVAVENFLAGNISFGEIPRLVADALGAKAATPSPDVQTALAADKEAREFARAWVLRRMGNK